MNKKARANAYMTPPKPRSQYLLVLSFGLLLLVLTALMALGMTRIESFNQQLNELTDAHLLDIYGGEGWLE